MRRKKGLSFYNKRKKISTSIIKEIWSYVFIVFTAVLLAFVLVYSIGMRTHVVGVSMEPNLFNGQEILINRLSVKLIKPKRGDVIVFLPNGNQNSHLYVKRVVGLSGDTIQIKEGRLYINNQIYDEYSYDKIADSGIAENPIKLASDEYFVLGDNVNNSEDSRSANVGAIKRDTIVGKAWFHMAAEGSSVGFMK